MLYLWIFGDNVEDRLGHAAGGATAFWAHIGGFVAGAIVGTGLRSRDRRWQY